MGHGTGRFGKTLLMFTAITIRMSEGQRGNAEMKKYINI